MDKLKGFLRHTPSLPTLFILLIILIWVGRISQEGHVEKVPYSQFKAMIAEGRFSKIELSKDLVRGTLNPDDPAYQNTAEDDGPLGSLQESTLIYQTVRVTDDEQLVKLLDERKLTYEAVAEDDWLVPLLWMVFSLVSLIVLWGFLMRRMGAGGQGTQVMSFGKARAKVYAEESTEVTFDDVAGVEEAKEELEEFVAFLKTPEKFQRLGGRIPKGVLLVGPPGTGKTLLARAVAGEAGVPFFSLSGSDFVEMFVGVGAARVRDLFEQAVKRAPCIVFIDELDAIGKARGAGGMMGGNDERDQTLNQLLVEMDGFDARKGVILMAATNRPEILDPALTRAGRFDRQVSVGRPNLNERVAILTVHAKKIKLSDKVDITQLAQRTPGFAGAELANLINEAALLAARRDKDAVEMDDFNEAIERVIAGLSKKQGILNEKERRIVAYHEAGHALVALHVENADSVAKISIIPRGMGALGYTLTMPQEDRYLSTRLELLDRIAVLFGGRIAEQLIFKDVSTGAQDDLMRATEIARRMIKDFGMSTSLGARSFSEGGQTMLGGNSNPFAQRDYSEETQKTIDQEITRIINEQYRRVENLLEVHSGELEALATALLDREVIEAHEIADILGRDVKVLRPLTSKKTTQDPLESPETVEEGKENAPQEIIGGQNPLESKDNGAQISEEATLDAKNQGPTA